MLENKSGAFSSHFHVENKLNDWKSGIVINVIKKL